MKRGSEPEQPRSREGGAPPVTAPHKVGLPVNLHRWERISFLHWPFEPEAIAPLVPPETAALTYDGAAWISVTPFFIRVRPPGVPAVPRLSAFPETNVRTYVTTPDGREGLWFIRMEVSARWFVAVMRAFGLPYFRQRMSIDVDDGRITYRSEPPSSTIDGGHQIVVAPGEEIRPPGGGPRDRFLTARWGAFHRRGPALLYTPVEHPRWPLRSAVVDSCAVGSLFEEAGLPPPGGAALAHFSAGVSVKVGRPRVIA